MQYFLGYSRNKDYLLYSVHNNVRIWLEVTAYYLVPIRWLN